MREYLPTDASGTTPTGSPPPKATKQDCPRRPHEPVVMRLRVERLYDDLRLNFPGCDCGEDRPGSEEPDSEHETWCPVYILWRLQEILAPARPLREDEPPPALRLPGEG